MDLRDDGAVLRLRVEQHRGARGCVEVLSITGDLDVLGASRLREQLPDPVAHLRVADLSEVAFLDSSGVGALIAMQRRQAEAGGSFAVCCAQPQPLQVLTMTGADRLLAVRPTLVDALGLARTAG